MRKVNKLNPKKKNTDDSLYKILSYYSYIQYSKEAREKNDMLRRDMKDIFFKRNKLHF